MATMASANLLTLFNQMAGRPASGDSITDPEKYARLSAAQNVVVEDAASRVPKALYYKGTSGSWPTLSTTDNQVFSFGTDLNGNPLFPIGKVRIFPSLSAIPDYPWVEGMDYTWEGTSIRLPNNTTYGGTLYWQGIAQPIDITAMNQPTVVPVSFRQLIVYEAVRRYAMEGGTRNMELFQLMDAAYDKMFRSFCLTLKTAYSNGGALGSVSGLRLNMMASGGAR